MIDQRLRSHHDLRGRGHRPSWWAASPRATRVSDDGHTITLKIRPGQTFHSGNPVRCRGRGLLAAARDHAQQDARLHPLPARLDAGQRRRSWSRRPTTRRVELTITEDFAPTFVLNCLSAGVGSVVDKKLVLEHEPDGDLGYEWLKTPLRGLGRLRAQVAGSPTKSVSLEANPDHRLGAPAMQAGGRPPCPRAVPRSACCSRRATSTSRAISPRPDRGDRRQCGSRGRGFPEGRPPLSRPQSEGRAPGQAEGARGDALAGRLPGHGRQLPAAAGSRCTRRSGPPASSPR